MTYEKFESRELMKEAVELAEKHFKKLHAMPEMAFKEFKTTEYIKDVCRNHPLRIVDIEMETGLVAYLDAGCKDCIALRADIDAVPTEHGPEHLCGHDAHTATMLGAIHYLSGIKEKLKHNILFIFQPAEEGTRGAKAMLEQGLMEKLPKRPSCIYGIHNRPEADCGYVIAHKGPLMSRKSIFRIKLTGRVGHGAMPHKCVDPIVAAAEIVTGVQTIVSRNVDPFKPAICTVSSISAGTTESSAPETAALTGYIRSLDDETHKRMEERLSLLVKDTAEAFECRCDFEIIPMVPAVDNSPEMYEKAYEAAKMAVAEDCIIDSNPSLASEDFAVFGEIMPAFLYWVGSGTAGKENAMWHSVEFRIGEEYFKTAVPVLAASAMV